MIPASLCISQLLTYFVGNLKAFFSSCIGNHKRLLELHEILIPVPFPCSPWLFQHILAFFSLLVDKASKYFEVKKGFFNKHLIFSTTATLNLSLSFSCCCHMDCKDREVGSGGRGGEIKIKIFFFPLFLTEIRGKSDSECCISSKIFPAARELSKHCSRYSHWEKVMSKTVVCYCSLKRKPQAGGAVVPTGNQE